MSVTRFFADLPDPRVAGPAGANLGLIRRVAASLLEHDPERGSIKRKRLTAALDEGYLMQVLQGFTAD